MNNLEKILTQLDDHLNTGFILLSRKATLQYAFTLPPTHPTEREAYAFLTRTDVILFHSPFISPPKNLPLQIGRHHLRIIAMSPTQTLAKILSTYMSGFDSVAIEAEDLTVAEKERLCQLMQKDLKTTAIDNVLKKVRQIKNEQEISNIKKAISISTKTLKWVHNFVTSQPLPNITEIELMHHINTYMYSLGAEDIAFPSIVAFDTHTASPHHVPTKSRLKPNSVVLIDIGAKYGGYCADLTRTWQLGQPYPEFTQVEKTVKKAYRAAAGLLKNLTSAPTAADIDRAARSVIEVAGFGANYIHTTGHGLGLEAHESPSLSSANQEPLERNMVVTIEPGIYLPGQFGYRYENTLVIG